MSDPEPKGTSQETPKRPDQKKPIGDPPRRPVPYPVDGPIDDGAAADPDYLPGDRQQPEDLPKRMESARGSLVTVLDCACVGLACGAGAR